MTFDPQVYIDAIMDHALASGHFVKVNGHEPKSAPGNGLTAAVWNQDGGPAIGASSLDSTTLRLEFSVRLYSPMIMEPQDAIDPALMRATSALFEAYSGDLTLGGDVRDVDLLGAHGVPLSWKSGYMPQDNKMFRIITITVPLIINDVFAQVR